MSGPVPFIPPDPWWIYTNGLPYQFPLVDQQPVVRMSVAGPAPFDTLVVVRTVAQITDYAWSNGEYHPHHGVVVPTPFVSTAAAAHVRPKHSSSAVLRMLQISAQVDDSGPIPLDDDNTSFTLAVDAVHPDSHFDSTGRWCVTIDDAWQAWQVYSACTVEISSWVLVQERSTPSHPHIDTSLASDDPWWLTPSPTVVRDLPIPPPAPGSGGRAPKRSRPRSPAQ